MKEDSETPVIDSWHAHIYFDEASADRATEICDRAGEALPVQRGRIHHRPVGPHPCFSCQLAFGPEHLRTVVDWLTLNRDGLTVFLHPNTGDELSDHRDRAIWFGRSMTLDLGVFSRSA